MLTSIILSYNRVMTRLKFTLRYLLSTLLLNLSPLSRYYRITDLMWQDGLLIDFLQKKVADKWIRRFLVSSSYVYAERVLFTFATRFYIDFVIWPLTTLINFEFTSVAPTLSVTLLSVALLAVVFNLNYLFLILF